MSVRPSGTSPAATDAAAIGERQAPYGAACGIRRRVTSAGGIRRLLAAAGSATPDGAVLALDVGTSSCRASLYDMRARRLPWRSERVGYSVETTPAGGAELDARRLLHQLRETIDAVL